jgi:hypothetical protein
MSGAISLVVASLLASLVPQQTSEEVLRIPANFAARYERAATVDPALAKVAEAAKMTEEEVADPDKVTKRLSYVLRFPFQEVRDYLVEITIISKKVGDLPDYAAPEPVIMRVPPRGVTFERPPGAEGAEPAAIFLSMEKKEMQDKWGVRVRYLSPGLDKRAVAEYQFPKK